MRRSPPAVAALASVLGGGGSDDDSVDAVDGHDSFHPEPHYTEADVCEGRREERRQRRRGCWYIRPSSLSGYDSARWWRRRYLAHKTYIISESGIYTRWFTRKKAAHHPFPRVAGVSYVVSTSRKKGKEEELEEGGEETEPVRFKRLPQKGFSAERKKGEEDVGMRSRRSHERAEYSINARGQYRGERE